MTPNVTNSASSHLLNTTVSGGVLTVIAQNASVITVIVVVITGVTSIWLNRRNTKANERSAAASEKSANANEKRNEVNERDITYAIIKKLEKDGLCDEAQKIRDSLNK
jgi:hypothetical protein